MNDPVLVVGGGLVGVKSVEALLARKRKVHWAISSQRILSQMLDRTASGLFLKVFEKYGVEVHLQTDVMAFEGTRRVKSALLSDGRVLPCGLAVIGKGIKPNVELLSETGITLNPGILVDQRMATHLHRSSRQEMWPICLMWLKKECGKRLVAFGRGGRSNCRIEYGRSASRFLRSLQNEFDGGSWDASGLCRRVGRGGREEGLSKRGNCLPKDGLFRGKVERVHPSGRYPMCRSPHLSY